MLRFGLRLLACGGLAGVLLLTAAVPVLAAPANPQPFPLTQPDGTTFLARQYGDEWHNGLETLEGYTILPDPETGYWVYAVLDGWGNLVPGARRVGLDAPQSLPHHLRAQRSRPPYAPPLNAVPRAPWPGVKGNLPTLFILVEFNDQAHVGSSAAQWANRAFGTSGSTVKAYYNEVSYGALSIVPANESHGTANDGVVGWLKLNQNHPNTGSSNGNANRQLAADAIQASDSYVDYAQYDTNHDGYISNTELLVVVIVAGYERSYSSQVCGPTVWGHQWSLGWGGVNAPQMDGVYVGAWAGDGSYAEFGEWHCDKNYDNPGHMATIGIMVHEMGHLLNWPDLYDTDYSSAGVGDWSVMGGGSWGMVSLPGDSPAHPDAFSKLYQGWITPQVYTLLPTSPTDVSIPQVESNAYVLQLLGNPNGVDWNFYRQSGSGEYFLIENRQLAGFDASLPGCGLLIWHIDESVVEDNTANADENHPLVALLQADGNNDLYNDANRGDDGDPFPGSTGNTMFSATTNPNSNLYGGPSGVQVEVLTSVCKSSMKVRLSTPFTQRMFLPLLLR